MITLLFLLLLIVISALLMQDLDISEDLGDLDGNQ